MSEDIQNNVATTSLNTLVDARIRTKTVQDEEYSKGDEGNKIAIKHQPLTDTEATTGRSWALAEIERTIAAEVLPVGRQKIQHFGMAMSRRNDFRLRDLARRLDRQTRMEFPDDVPTPRGAPRPKSGALQQIRDFDVRAHSFRQISTNATLASYQFQRNTVLPYMRKSLALDFQKTSLLKKVVGGISSLEKSVVAKLEAIKMNTGASAPTKVGLFTRLRNAVRDKQIDRVAGNIANRIMDRHSKTWQKHVAPIITKLNGIMKDDGPRGGFNGANRRITSKFNKLRKSLGRVGDEAPDPANPLSGFKQNAAKVGSRVLGGIVGAGQRFKLTPGMNKVVTAPLAMATDFANGLNPFSGGELDKGDIDDLEASIKKGSISGPGTPQITSIIGLLQDWKASAEAGQTQLLQHVSGIREHISSGMIAAPAINPRQKPTAGNVLKPKRVVRAKPKAADKSPTIAPSKAAVPLPVMKTEAAPAAPTTAAGPSRLGALGRKLAYSAVRGASSLSLKYREAGQKTTNQFGRRLLNKLKGKPKSKTAATAPGVDKPKTKKRSLFSMLPSLGSLKAKASPVASTVTSPAGLTGPRNITAVMPLTATMGGMAATAGAAAKPAMAFATSTIERGQTEMTQIMAQLGGQLANINETLREGNTARTMYEGLQTKRQKLADTITSKLKVRKNSYEDMMANRKAKIGVPISDQLKNTAASLAASVKARWSKDGAAEEGGEESPSLIDQVKDMFLNKEDEDGDKDDAKKVAAQDDDETDEWGNKKKKGKNRSRSRFRRGRAGARGRLGRIRNIRSNRGVGGFLKRTVKGTGKLGLGAAKGLGRGSLGALKLGGKGALGALKLGGKGALTFAKSGVGMGAIGALAANAAGSALEGSDAPDSVKALGGTLTSMASYGSTGAAIGGMFGGIGAVPGAAIGAAVGAIVANADAVSSALSKMSTAGLGAAKGIWSTIFGQNAKYDENGKIIQQEKTSILGDLKTAFFGRDAKYSADGQQIMSARGNILSNIKYGFEKTLFGDRYSNGEFKEGTSLLDQARDGLKGAITSFGDQLMNLPQDLSNGFKKGAVYKAAKATKDGVMWAGGKISDGAVGTKNAFAAAMNAKDDINKQPASISAMMGLVKAFQDFSWKDTKNSLSNIDAASVAKYSSWLTPTGFMTGVSNAIYGWWTQSDDYNDPAKPLYKYVDLVLGAYGIKNRTLYKYLHSIETSQEKINKNQAKPFDDQDMAFMAGRFGFDSKNSDAVNYFKMWYKRRFLPGMLVIDKALKSRRLTFDSILAADDKQVLALNDVLKKEIAGAGLAAIGLEPSVSAYNKYAKEGVKDPGGLSQSALNKDKPYDPRDPNSRANSEGANNYNPNASSNDYDSGSNLPPAEAKRKKAAMEKGKIMDQPEFKAAFNALPPEVKRAILKSRALQFVLWSSAVQHGAKGAALIFQRDYVEQDDESTYIRKIYADRSQQFGKLGADERAGATAALGREQRFTGSIMNGTADMTRGNLSGYVNNVYDPEGGYNTNVAEVKGTVKQRAAQAMQYLMEKGYPKAAAAGIVGNLIKESTLNPGNTTGDGGNSHGIAQWNGGRGAGYRRLSLEKKFLGGQRVASVDMFKQLDAIDWEMTTGHDGHVSKDLKPALMNAKDPAQAAVMFMRKFERPADNSPTGQEANVRAGHARNMMSIGGNVNAPKIEGKPTPASGGTPSTQSGGGTPKPVVAKTPSQKPAAKAAPKKVEPAHDMNQWGKALASSMDNHSKALREHGDLVSKNSSGGTPKPNSPTVISPIIVGGQKGGGEHWAAASMKKSLLVTGK